MDGLLSIFYKKMLSINKRLKVTKAKWDNFRKERKKKRKKEEKKDKKKITEKEKVSFEHGRDIAPQTFNTCWLHKTCTDWTSQHPSMDKELTRVPLHLKKSSVDHCNRE